MSHLQRSFTYLLRLWLALLLVCAPLHSFVCAQAVSEHSSLLETGSAQKPPVAPATPDTIKIVSYNIRWRGGDDLSKLIALLRDDPEIGRATIIGLQEVDRNKKRTGNVNTVRRMAEELGLYYAWAAPPPPEKNQKPQEEETGVAILSPYPLADVRRFVLPNEGPNGRRRAAIGATVQIGSTPVRAYSLHAETRTTNERRLQQFQAVLDDAQQHHAKIQRIVVLGDFNTTMGKDVEATSKLFTGAHFQTPFSNDEETWRTFIIKLKLDWLWLRGLTAIEHGIDRDIGLSDHWPLWTKARMK